MKFGLMCLLLVFVLSCKGDAEELLSKKSGDVQIRIWNGTKYEMTDLFVNTSGGENEFGTLTVGKKSAYKGFYSAYRYAFVSFKIDGQAVAIQPIDYFGEQPIAKGHYTYKIASVDINSGIATLEFIVE